MSIRTAFLLLILMDVGRESVAQPGISFSPRHAEKISSATTGVNRLKLYRKYFTRDSARHVRKLEKLHRKKWDSLVRATRKAARDAEKAPHADKIKMRSDIELAGLLALSDTARLDRDVSKIEISSGIRNSLKTKYGLSGDEIEAFCGGDTSVRARVRDIIRRKMSLSSLPLSAGQQKQVEHLQSSYGKYSEETSHYVAFLKDSVKRMDSIKSTAVELAEKSAMAAGNRIDGMSDLKELQSRKSELETYRSSINGYRDQMETVKDPDKLKLQGVEQLVEQKERLAGLTNKISGLKGKLSTLLNSNDLSTGIKAKSLSGRPVRERWVIGGNFNIVSTTPFMLDLGLQFGYRIDKRFQVGISAIYRATFVATVNWTNAISPERIGYSAFASYGLLGNFFGYAEWENTASHVRGLGDQLSTVWVSSLLVGVGRTFAVHPKVKGSILVLGNLLHENGRSPYHSPLVIKTGFQLTPLALMKR